MLAINMAYGTSNFRDSFMRKLEETGGVNCKTTHKMSLGEPATKKSRKWDADGDMVKEVCRQNFIPLNK